MVGGSVKLVCAALGDGVDLSGATAILRGVGVGLDLELLDFVYGGNGGDGIEVGRSVDGAIQEEIGVLRARAAHGILIADAAADIANLLKCCIAVLGEGDAWAERSEIQEAAPIQRQIRDASVIDDLSDRARFG